MTNLLISVANAEEFLEKEFQYKSEFKNIGMHMRQLEDIFGEDCFVFHFTKYKYSENGRWTHYFDIIYFKSESDLSEFKLRFL